MASALTDDRSVTQWTAGAIADGHNVAPRSRRAATSEIRETAGPAIPAARRVGIGFWRALPLALLVSALLWGAVVKVGLSLL